MVSHFVRNIYFKEVSKKKILSKEEQLSLAKEIYDLKKQLEEAPNSKDKEKIQDTIRNRRDRLIESCYFIVVKIAKKHRNRYLSLFDLIEEGNLALIKAIDTFDYRMNIKFSTYVSILVKNKILTSIAHSGKMIRVSNSYQYGSSSFVPITSSGQAPFRTISKQLGMDSSKMFKVIKNLQVQTMVSQEQSIDQTMLEKLYFYNHSSPYNPEFELFKNAMTENLKRLKKILSPKEYDIINQYYGLDNGPPRRYNKIAKGMSLTSERVRQIHNQAIEKIKKSEMNLILKDFLSEN